MADPREGAAANNAARPELADVKALAFDVFGTVVDWHGSVAREVRALAAAKGLRVNPVKFAKAWRAGYKPAMDEWHLLKHFSESPSLARGAGRGGADVSPVFPIESLYKSIEGTSKNSHFVIPAKAGIQSNQASGSPPSRGRRHF